MTHEQQAGAALRRLLIVHRERDAEADSAELRYATTLLRREALAVFAEVSVTAADEMAAAPESTDTAILLLPSSCYLSRFSLGRMRKRLEQAPDDCVLSYPIHAFDLSGFEAIMTPSGYTRVEKHLLTTETAPAHPAQGQAPVIMARPGRGRQTVDNNDPDTLLPQAAYGDAHTSDRGIHFQFSDYYGSERRDLLPYIAPRTRSILEIGCAKGNTGHMLKQELGCRVTGIELNAEAAAIARQHLDQVHVGDFSQLRLDERFDTIIAADVVEHQDDINGFLRDMRKLLAPGGRLLMSIPNVGHHSLVEDLLAGRWDYLPQGLLCITHLRFFTRATLQDWLTDQGVSRFEIHAQSQTELPTRFEGLAGTFGIDTENLRTPGFYVVVHAD